MMSRRLPKKSKRFREAREQVAHDKVVPTHGSGASSLERRERRLEALQQTSRRVNGESLDDPEMAPAQGQIEKERQSARLLDSPGRASASAAGRRATGWDRNQPPRGRADCCRRLDTRQCSSELMIGRSIARFCTCGLPGLRTRLTARPQRLPGVDLAPDAGRRRSRGQTLHLHSLRDVWCRVPTAPV